MSTTRSGGFAMRDLQKPGRSRAHGREGMACTSHATATLAAIDILRAGGNAVDAAIGACAVQCVVEPGSTGIGGDCFAILATRDGKVEAYNGSGRAPAAIDADALAASGETQVPGTSPHAVTVPGAIEAWAGLNARHGRLGLDRVLARAIDLAENGYVMFERVARDRARNVDKLSLYPETAEIFLPGGRAPKVGEIHSQPKLGASLRAIAEQGPDVFYRGWIAEDIVATLRAKGGVHELSDLAAHKGEWVTPIRTGYRGFEVLEIPPNGQGITALIGLNVLKHLPLQGLDPLGALRFHLEAEAMRLAYQDRNFYVADQAFADVPVAALLSDAHARDLAALIRPDRAMSVPLPRVPMHGDTIYLCVVDGDGLAVSFINSLFASHGSGITAPRSGVVLQNRGCGFVLDEGHPNRLEPGKRPMHTIIPGMLLESGRARMPFGVMGGHFQPTGHVHLLTNMLDLGMDPQRALDCPRGLHFGGVYALENGVPERTAAGLAGLGHRVERARVPHGGGQAIWIDRETGVLTGGSDPRKDGIALGF
jgi:gamma-glutamyltranspeptidase / glutathione hydrolase